MGPSHGMAALLVAVVVVVAGFGDLGAASSECEGGFDTKPVTRTLQYSGPNQNVAKKSGGGGGGSAGLGAFRCFRGQHWEDLYVFQHLLHGVGGGTFVELGALDGYSYSVTYFFEVFLKWRGLLIEASPQNHALFETRSRRVKPWQRRNVPYVHAAVCGEPMPLTYVSKEGTGAGILEFMAPDQQRRNREMCVNATSSSAGPSKHECVLTPIRCVQLGRLLQEHRMDHVDLFVLDVEGAEDAVLETLDLMQVPVRYFLIELDGTAPAKDASVRCRLRRAGFEPLGRLDLNELWVNRRFPHERFASTYRAVKPAAWQRCFRGSHVDFLKGPRPFFGDIRYDAAAVNAPVKPRVAASDSDVAARVALANQQAGLLAQDPDSVGGDDAVVGAPPQARVIDSRDTDGASFDVSATWVLILVVLAGFTGYAVARRRGHNGNGNGNGGGAVLSR